VVFFALISCRTVQTVWYFLFWLAAELFRQCGIFCFY